MRQPLDRAVRRFLTDRAVLVDRLVATGLLVWALPDVPWWWRPAGHSRATPVVVGILVLALAQSVPFLWRRRVPGPGAGAGCDLACY
jgi:hypothetical protein